MKKSSGKDSKTLKRIEKTMKDRNVIPYCHLESISENKYWDKSMLENFPSILAQGSDHPMWEGGPREGFFIAVSQEPVVIVRRDVIPDKKSKRVQYVTVHDRALYCPMIFCGPDIYAVVSVHRGRVGLLAKAMESACKKFLPEGSWAINQTNGHFSINGKEFSGAFIGSYQAEICDYSVEMGYLITTKDDLKYSEAFDSFIGLPHDGITGLLDEFPDFPLEDFIEYLYDYLPTCY